jgi:hypothetical protein
LRKINFDEFMIEKKKEFFSLRARLGKKKLPARRKRDPEKRKFLMIMDKNRFYKWIEKGELQMISLRHFLVKL